KIVLAPRQPESRNWGGLVFDLDLPPRRDHFAELNLRKFLEHSASPFPRRRESPRATDKHKFKHFLNNEAISSSLVLPKDVERFVPPPLSLCWQLLSTTV